MTEIDPRMCCRFCWAAKRRDRAVNLVPWSEGGAQDEPMLWVPACQFHTDNLPVPVPDLEPRPLTGLTLNQVGRKAHATAVGKGWWEGLGTLEAGINIEMAQSRIVEILLNMHREIDEAADEFEKDAMETYWVPAEGSMSTVYTKTWLLDVGKRAAGGDGLCQQLIRIAASSAGLRKSRADYAAMAEETSEYFRTNPKFKPEGFGIEIVDTIIRGIEMLWALGYDVDELYRVKQAFNETRQYRHGGKKL